jgi:enoyl-CoA hydratase/carnithine racemase
VNTLEVGERDDRVIVILNRPQARNAINAAMIGELHQVCAALEPGAHPLADDLAQAVLFETAGKRDRMTAFLERRPS